MFRILQRHRSITGDSFSQGLEFDAGLGFKFLEYDEIQTELMNMETPQNGNP